MHGLSLSSWWSFASEIFMDGVEMLAVGSGAIVAMATNSDSVAAGIVQIILLRPCHAKTALDWREKRNASHPL